MLGKGPKSILVLSALAFEFSFALAGGFLAGYYLDMILKTKPYFTYIFLVLGIMVSAKIFWMILKKVKHGMEEK